MLVVRDEFTVELAKLKPALSSGGIVQELSHFWFDKANAYAFDGGFGVKLKLKTELDCGVPGAQLLGLLSTSALKEASLELNGVSLAVKLGKSSSKLVTLEASRKVWPFPVKMPKGVVTLELGEDFIEALRKSLFIKASPATRVEHHGVMLQSSKNGLELFSTDSATMARVTVEAKASPGVKVLLPRDFAAEIVAQSPGGVTLLLAKDCTIAEADGISFYSNMLDISTADDLSTVVEKNLGKHPKGVALPAGLGSALERAEILAGNKDAEVWASVEKDTLVLSGDYPFGALSEKLPLDDKHPSVKLRLQAGLLRRALPYAESFSLTESSLILRGEPGFTYVIAGL